MELSRLVLPLLLSATLAASSEQQAQVRFAATNGDFNNALTLYENYVKGSGSPDYALLKALSIAFLQSSVSLDDNEAKLMSLYGAGLSQSEELIPLFERGLKSKNPQLQAISLHFLARLSNNKADDLIFGLLKNPNPLIQLEALFALAQKKHPKAGALAESMMSKYPALIKPIFPAIFSEISTRRSDALLRQLLHDSDENVRLETIRSLVKAKRDDFAPRLQRLGSQTHQYQQETLAVAFEVFRDETMIPRLETFTKSNSPYVVTAAMHALYKLGKTEYHKPLIELANSGFPYAVFLLHDVKEASLDLITLSRSPNTTIRLNAAAALLQAHLPGAKGALDEVLFNSHGMLALQESSPGKALSCLKWAPAHYASQKKGPAITAHSQNLRRSLLAETINLDEADFLYLSGRALETNQIDLIPLAVKLLENHGSTQSEIILKKNAVRIGAPYARQFSNLALFRMTGSETYASQVRAWVVQYSQNSFAKLKPYLPFELRAQNEYLDLSPEEQTTLYLESIEALAASKKNEDIQTLLTVLKTGNSANRYLLSGVLIRAIQ